MATGSALSELSKSLTSGFFADNAVVVLAKLRRGQALTPRERETLREIEDFFSSVLTGLAWGQNPRLSSHSATTALALSQAVSVVALGRDSKHFRDKMQGLLDTSRALVAGGRAQRAKLDRLIEFFTGLSRSQLEETDRILTSSTALGSRRYLSVG